MKVIIIEGPDNVGKTTLISQLFKKINNGYNRIYYIHFSKPKADDPIYAAIEQKNMYEKTVGDVIYLKEADIADVVILDRSWLGEYVYGCKYRGCGEKYALDNIKRFYKNLQDTPGIECYTVVLTVDNPDFCVKNDDNNSISQAKKEEIFDEIVRFNKVFYDIYPEVTSNGARVIVNDNMEFRGKKEILNEVLKAIKVDIE